MKQFLIVDLTDDETDPAEKPPVLAREDQLGAAIERARAFVAPGRDIGVAQIMRRVTAEQRVTVAEIREPIKVAERNGNGHDKPRTIEETMAVVHDRLHGPGAE